MPQRLLDRGNGGASRRSARCSIDLRNYQPFLFLLGSFFVPLFGVLLADWLLAGRHYARDGRLRRRRSCAVAAARRLARRLLPLPVAVPGRPGAGGRGSSRTPTRTRCRGAAPRCRASRSRSRSPPLAGLARPAGPALGARVIALLGNLSRDFLPGAATADRRRAVPRRPRAPAARNAGR